ncbi:MAG: hypothetical protein ACOZE5_12365 [Verrucomicrobiota bacterium]
MSLTASLFSTLRVACRRATLPVAVVLLSGCATSTSRTPPTVSAAPAPAHGSARIVAYDAYASAFITQTDHRKALVVMATLLAAEPEPAHPAASPVAAAPVVLN